MGGYPSDQEDLNFQVLLTPIFYAVYPVPHHTATVYMPVYCYFLTNILPCAFPAVNSHAFALSSSHILLQTQSLYTDKPHKSIGGKFENSFFVVFGHQSTNAEKRIRERKACLSIERTKRRGR